MKNKRFLLLPPVAAATLSMGFSSYLPANTGALPDVQFSTGAYQNNAKMEKVLSIPGADGLTVTVTGQSEAERDRLRIYSGDMKYHREFSGTVNEAFTVSSDTVKITFNADGRATAAGLTVKIEAYSPITEFEHIKRKIMAAVEAISTNGAGDARQEILKNIRVFQQLFQELQNTPNVDTLIPRIIEGLESVSRSYALISGMNEKIQTDGNQEFEHLKELMEQTRQNRERIQERKITEEKEHARLSAEVQKEENSNDRRKKEISLKGRENIIESLRVQVLIWSEFYDTQTELLKGLQAHMEKIDLLLHVLKVNSRVYREAAHAMQLRRSMKLALQALADLSDLQDVLKDIEANWGEVSKLRTKIDKANFLHNGGEGK